MVRWDLDLDLITSRWSSSKSSQSWSAWHGEPQLEKAIAAKICFVQSWILYPVDPKRDENHLRHRRHHLSQVKEAVPKTKQWKLNKIKNQIICSSKNKWDIFLAKFWSILTFGPCVAESQWKQRLSADWPDSSTSPLTTSSSPPKPTDLNVQACRRKSTPN